MQVNPSPKTTVIKKDRHLYFILRKSHESELSEVLQTKTTFFREQGNYMIVI